MKTYLKWLTWAAIITVIFGTIYAVAQQTLRLGADDSATEIAENVAASLNSGKVPGEAISTYPSVDAGGSLSPFAIIYDELGGVVAGTGTLEGNVPVVPVGVLHHARVGHNNSVTWQPKGGVRIAAVAVSAGDYYVLGGHNIREVEAHENTILDLALFGWMVSLAGLGLIYWLSTNKLSHKPYRGKK